MLIFPLKYSKQIITSGNLDETRPICAYTKSQWRAIFLGLLLRKHTQQPPLCTLKSRYVPPFTSIGLADKYVQANASCKHASAHPLIIFCTWNFSAPLQFAQQQNEFSYFFSQYTRTYMCVQLSQRAYDFLCVSSIIHLHSVTSRCVRIFHLRVVKNKY